MKAVLVALALLASGAATAAAPQVEAALGPTLHSRLPRALGASVHRLERLGPDALGSMLALAADPAAIDRLTAGEPLARARVLAALAEALSSLRDPAAAPAFRALVDDASAGDEARSAAARGLGMLCRDEDVSFLSARLGSGTAAALGLAPCRRAASASALLGRLRVAAEPAEVEALARSLGRLGSSWAWEALGPARAAEGAALRGRIAAGLVDAYLALPGSRQALLRALRMVDAPETDALLARAASRDPAAGALRATLRGR